VLAVDIAQVWGEFAEESAGNGAAGDEGSGFAVSLDSRSTKSSLSSISMPAASSNLVKEGLGVTSKMPETRARSAPARIMSEEARPPKRRPRASTTIDLPLPVSPVSRFRPRWKRTRRRSMTA